MSIEEVLYIADVQFNINLNQILPPVPKYINQGYRHFFLQTPLYNPIHSIDVEISQDAGLDISRMRHVFIGSNAWRILSNSKDNFIVFDIPHCDRPLWIAWIQSDYMKVTIYCSQDMIDAKQFRLLFNPVCYPLDQIFLMLYLTQYKGGIFYGAGWMYHDYCFMFCGTSGAGKTTISKLIAQSGEGEILSDDRMVVRKIKDNFIAFGTPWPGEAGYAKNRSCPLKGIFFLTQGKQNSIRELKPSEAISRLLPVMSILWYDKEKVNRIMEFCDDLLRAIPLFQLTFTPDEALIEMIKDFVSNG